MQVQCASFVLPLEVDQVQFWIQTSLESLPDYMCAVDTLLKLGASYNLYYYRLCNHAYLVTYIHARENCSCASFYQTSTLCIGNKNCVVNKGY